MATDDYDQLRHTLEERKNVISPFADSDWKKITLHLESLKKRQKKKPSLKIRKENIATTLAFWIPIGYILMLILALIYVPIYNWFMVHYVLKTVGPIDLLNVKDVFTMINTPLGPIVGVAIAHFFNTKNDA